MVRAQQEFPDDFDIIQVEARLRSELDQKDRALRALERAWAAGPRGSGLAVRVARIYEARNRDEEAEKVLKEALTRHPDDKAARHMLALHYLRQATFDASRLSNTSGAVSRLGIIILKNDPFWPSSSFSVAR